MPIDENEKKPVRVYCVTGGKGGVGKTFFSINFALSLCYSGDRVLLFDADLSLANIDVALGLQPKNTLADVLSGQCQLEDILLKGPEGLSIIPASSGIRQMTRLNQQENAGIINAFSEFNGQYDALVIDTAAGISDSVISFAKASQEIMIVLCNDPSSIADAYALIKTMCQDEVIERFSVVINMVDNALEAKNLFEKFNSVVAKFLDINLNYLGYVVSDPFVKKAACRRRALLDCYPSSAAAKNIVNIVQKINKRPKRKKPNGNIEFFIEQLVQSSLNQQDN